MPAVKFDIRHPGISVYEALTSSELSEQEKAKIIAEAIDTLSKEFPNLKDVATNSSLKETELRLTKEIEDTKKEIKELEVKLTKDIKELEIKLIKEIKDTKASIIKWVLGLFVMQSGMIIGAVVALARLIAQ